MFTWKPIYKELADRLLAYEARQGELIEILKEMEALGLPVVSTADKKDGKPLPLAEIDPFTFFASFNRQQTHDNRRAILSHIKAKLGLVAEVPKDFDGIPIVNNMKSWFFPYVATRRVDDVPSLWKLASQAVRNGPEGIDPGTFDRCLEITAVGPAKLTMGLFWLNPDNYIASDKVNQKLFHARGIDVDVEDFESYRRLIDKVNATLGADYPQISLTAYSTSEDEDAEENDGGDEADRSYWAGGFKWGNVSKLDEFTKNNRWQIGYTKDDPRPAAKRTWERFAQVRVGDWFAIKGLGGRYDLRVHYLGQVRSKSDDGTLELDQLDGPLFRDKAPSGPSWFDTLVPLTTQPVIDAIFGTGQSTAAPKTKIAHPLNTILYGTPGTGKTYTTIERAVSIIDGPFKGSHEEFKDRFDELQRQGRVGFITFHQSYSYEDFVEGIRPVLDEDEEVASPRYECRPGVFKRLATAALYDCLQPTEPLDRVHPFEVLWKALIAKIESDPEALYPGLTEKTSYQLTVTKRGNLEGNNVISKKSFFCSRKIVEKVFEAKRSQDTVTAAEVMAVVVRGCHSHLVAAVFNELKRIEESKGTRPATAAVRPRLSEEEQADVVQRFLEDGVRSGYCLRPESEWNRYVLVVDEINRGNISKILGELITLLEPDKRLPGMNGLVARLPYSGERFAVPANLYVLGTMNTADKSIALVDVALRRRFDFEELRVDFDVCEDLTEDMRNVLREMNRRISLRKDRDHQIGHAYFVHVASEEEFNARFRRQIIPLLQEFFYNDWDGLRYVLGQSPSATGGFVRKIEGADAREARTKWQWYFDEGAVDFDFLETLVSNYKPT